MSQYEPFWFLTPHVFLGTLGQPIREGFRRKSLCKNFVWRLTGALDTDMSAARRAQMSTGARLRFATSSGIADGEPYCRAFEGCLGLLVGVLQQNVVLPWRRHVRILPQ